MKNGKFTPEEKEYLFSLDAVDRITSTQIIYSKQFKAECMRRYNAGDRPSEIFDSVGLPASLIGHKRIERAISSWSFILLNKLCAATSAFKTLLIYSKASFTSSTKLGAQTTLYNLSTMPYVP